MQAVTFDRYGDPSVLHTAEMPEPHAGPGQVRIRVAAAAVNPMDWKIRRGYLADMMPNEFPTIPGSDAAGTIDEVGEGVTGVSVGDEVLGSGDGATAEFAVLHDWTRKPDSLDITEAAGLTMATETAERVLRMLDVKQGDTVLVDGAAGGVGAALVQLAVDRGATVIGTASDANAEYLQSLGANPTTYGPGLPDRLRAIGVESLDAAVDTAGKGSVAELVTLVPTPSQVVSIADFAAGEHGARVTDGSEGHAYDVLDRLGDLVESGYRIPVAETFTFAQAPKAHEESEGGHVRGKIVIVAE